MGNLIASGPGSEAARTDAPKRILLVDDHPDFTESLAVLLSLRGHAVTIVGDGLEAVAAAERDRPDTILLDLGLPRLDGYGVCRRIRARPWGQDIAIFALTGWAHDNDRRKSSEAGFDGHLVKPVELATLQQALKVCRPESAGGRLGDIR